MQPFNLSKQLDLAVGKIICLTVFWFCMLYQNHKQCSKFSSYSMHINYRVPDGTFCALKQTLTPWGITEVKHQRSPCNNIIYVANSATGTSAQILYLSYSSVLVILSFCANKASLFFLIFYKFYIHFVLWKLLCGFFFFLSLGKRTGMCICAVYFARSWIFEPLDQFQWDITVSW